MSRAKVLGIGIVCLFIALSVVSVRGQLVTCRASTNCAGGPGDDLGRAVDGRSCCLDNPRALAFSAGEGSCVACVVVGFLNNSFSGVEQGPGHSILVGYRKGSASNLVFNVGNVGGSGPDSAREGPQFDYTVNTVQVRALASGQTDNVVVTFRVDTIAQENNETFNLTLTGLNLPPSPGPGFFVIDTLPVAIVDSDTVQFSFTEDDYRANEPGPQGTPTAPPVIVSKSTRIANRVELVVVPLTVQNANATNLPLPPNIPDDDLRSPPFANLNDFNNTNITLVFEPDEGAEVSEKNAPIFITDDAINEATEQVFVAELLLIDSLNPASIDLTTRPSTLCRIIDNDPIRIGFEQPRYTYMEPQFDTPIDEFFERSIPPGNSGPIYLAKENNVTSEQTFLVSVQVTDSAPSGTAIQSATIDQDYLFGVVGRTSETIFFFPLQQRILVSFELLADTLPEGTEAFQASVSPEDTQEERAPNGTLIRVERFPTPLNPINLFPEAFIIILDDDPIVIGFTNTSYTVDEGIGTLQVDVQVFSPPDDQFIQGTTLLVIQTVSGSATGGSDYQEINAVALDYLTFDNDNRQQSFDVTIIDDSLFELDVEDFTLELRFDPFAISLPSNVILRPNVSTVEILDNDPVVIGFLNTSYTVGESDGVADIQIGVIEGSLQRPVVVQFSTSADSATAGSDYRESVEFEFTFDNVVTEVEASIRIMGDSTFELTELFGASLAFPGAPPPRVTLAPASAQVTILDDDVLTFGFEPVVYDVRESVGTVNLGISFINGDPGEFVPHVNASTVDGTATGSGVEADYNSVVEQSISFTTANTVQNLPVQIVSDNFTELNESFSAMLTSVFLARTAGGAAIDLSDQERARLIRNPDAATVNILDDDDAVIGFVNTDLRISEDGGELEFEIAVLQGNLRINVPVDFATADGSASAGLDYEATSSSLVFTAQSRQSVFVRIINDSLFEDAENFFGNLSAAGVLPPNVRLNPIQAIATIDDDDPIVIGFDPDTYNVDEPDGIVTLRVRLLRGIISEGRDILVRVATVDGSAQAPSDYGDISQVLTFSSSVSLQTVNVSIVNDNLLEIDEVFTASLTLENTADAARVNLQPDSAEVTILDEDMATIGFVPDIYSVMEGTDQFANLTVQLISGQLGREVIVNFNTQSGSATAGSDFVSVTGLQLIFNQAVSSMLVQVGIMDDNVLEELIENFTASLTSSVPRLTLLPDVAVVDIIDDDPVAFGFDSTQYSVLENASFVTVTIRQTSGGPLDRNVLITLQTGDGTAISSGEQDFEARSVELTFEPGVTERQVMIRIINDLRLEHDEQFNSFVSLTVADPAVTVNPAQASITIIDDDRVVIGFDQTLYQVNEDAGQAVVNVVVRMGTLRRPVVVNVFTADDTALDGSDYRAVAPTPLTFDRNNSVHSISIDIIDDQVHELNEDFFGRLSTVDEDVTLDPQETRVRIADDDVVTFTFRQPIYMFMENVGTGTVCVDKIGETDQTITVMVNGATQLGPLNMMLVFPPDTNSSCINFNVEDDNIALEDPEEFIWTLGPPPVPRVELTINTTRVVIIDDDPLVLNLVKAQDIPEAIGTAQACVTFSNPFARSFEISPSVGRPPNSSAIAIATPGLDYGDVIAPIMANPGDTQACFNIMIENDVLVEDNQECLMPSFTAESLVNLEIGTSSSVCCIVDDDNVTIGFDPAEYAFNETDGSVSLMVRVLAGQLARTVSVDFFTRDGTATSTAPADFEGVPEQIPITLQFSPSDLVQPAPVRIFDDDITENPELFTGLLSSIDSAVILAPDTASVEIRDNDPVTIGFDPDDYTVAENGGSVTLMVRLINGILEREVVVDFATSPGTATSADPADYERTVRQLTFSPTVNINPVSVNIINDNIHEDSETFLGTLSATGQPVILNPDTAVVTITDDIDPITIGFERIEYNVSEGDRVEVCAVLMSGILEKDVLVFVNSSDGTANVGADYNAVSETLLFNAGRSRVCFFTSAVDDDRFEDEEMYLLTLTSNEPGLTLNPDVATVTIPNDDRITIGLTNTTFVVTEGDGAFVEVCAQVFDGQLERNAIVTLQTMDGSAVSQGTEPDYQSLTVQLTFMPSMLEICRNVIIINDVFYEDPEQLTVGLTTDDVFVDLMPDEGTITILDEEAIIIGFVQPSYFILETEGPQRVCAEVKSGNLRTNVAVQFSTADGDAIAPLDYTATTATFTFNATQSRDCVDVPINPDNIIEGSESFTGNLDTSAPRVTLDPQETRITITEELPLIIGFIDPPYSTREESGFVTVSVGILNAGIVLDEDFVVNLQTMDIAGIQNAAQVGEDYEFLSMDLTFSSTVKIIDVNVTILDDNIVELTELFRGQLTIVTMGPNAPNATLLPQSAQISILDEVDRVTIGLTETLITVNESVGMREVCASVIEGDLERNAVVTLSLNPLTATAGEDYVTESFTLVFSETVRGPICNSVTILNDNIYEFEEFLTFNLSTTDTAVNLNPAGGVMIIQDEDEVVIGWERDLYQFNENAGQSRLCAVVLSGSLAVTLPALGIDTRDGTASRGAPSIQQDYIPTPTPDMFVFSSTNMGPICTNIPIVNDNLLEQTIEDFFADLAFAAGSEPDRVTVAPAITEVDIIDDDPITIGFLETSYTVSEGVGDAGLMIGVISGDLETNIVVNISTAEDSALSPEDYTGIFNQALTFSTRLPPMTVLVPINDDDLDEEDRERFTASLVLVTNNPRVQIAPPQTEVIIEDNDVVVIGFERTMYNTPENNSVSVTVCASVRSPPSLAKTVEVALNSADGTAIAPGDYNAVSRILTFSPSMSRQCVDFTGREDGIVEPNENFTVTLTTTGDDVVLDPDVAVVTIVEGVVIMVGFVEQTYTFVENQLVGTIQVRKDAASDVRFMVRVLGGPSTSSPIERSADAIDRTLTFEAGPSAPNVIDVMINITDDFVALEAIESYVATLEILGTPDSRIEIGQYPTTTISVLDDDRVTVGFGSDGVSVPESSGEFTMCVVRDLEALQDITFTIEAQDESAISGVDYTPSGIPRTVTIPASDPDMRTCFTGPIIDDLIALEPNETFTLSITNISPDSDRIVRGIDLTRITIVDDDVVRVRFAQPEYLYRETEGVAQVCLVKDLETAITFAVDSFTTPDTALDPSDYIGGVFGVTFGTDAGDSQCISINLVSDNEREEREQFFVDVDLDDMGAIRAGNPSRTTVGIEDTGIPANDTVIGDPLMTVPILVSDSVLQMLNATRLSLCYEIHGRPDAFFNLVTDECATVNAHYHDLTNYLNVIDQIGVRAVDENGMCRNIQVDVDSCAASIDGTPLAAGGRYSSGGISVRSYSNRVRISVPNCAELTLVMWVICETRTLEDPFGAGVVTGDMIKFVVARGLNFGHRKAHGLLGQFWNIPVSVEPFKGLDRNGNPVPERYVVNITSSFSGERRSYTGWLYDLTWSFEEGPCLYVGNRQAGPIYEVKDPNDPIIEGRYSEYLVKDLFSEEEFKYTLFDEDNCLASPIPTNLPQ